MTGREMINGCERVTAKTQFARRPTLGIDVMGQNNAMSRDQITRANPSVERIHQAQAREAAEQALVQISTDGPT